MNTEAIRASRRVHPDAAPWVPYARMAAFALMFACVGSVPSMAQTERSLAKEKTKGVSESSGPKISFTAPVFDFGQIKHGETVRHDFVFSNTGTSVLEITGVKPGCGCTTAGAWDKRVEPGRTGIIPLQLNSSGFSGSITKTATVTTNDPSRPSIELQLTGKVWAPFEITPQTAIITVASDAEAGATKVVRIVSRVDEPVTLSGLESSSPSFRAELKATIPGKEYEVHIMAVPPFPSRMVLAYFNVKTSLPDTPVLKVTAQVLVQEPVIVSPTQLSLLPGSLRSGVKPSVTIRNNGAAALVLSDAKVNVPGSEVKVREVQPGKLFQVSVQFPAGFELRPEDVIEMTVKSNHLKYPVIRVPVVAAQRPASAAKASPNTPANRITTGASRGAGSKE